MPAYIVNQSGPRSYEDFSATYQISGPKPEVKVIKNNYDINELTKDDNILNNVIIVISPNVYQLCRSIKVSGTFVILGIGMPTIRAPKTEPAIVASDINGGILAGILVEASLGTKDCLINWGGDIAEDNNNEYSFIHDLYCRVGGNLDPRKCCVRVSEAMVKISKSKTIIDNAWLWVADHGKHMLPSGMCNVDKDKDKDKATWEDVWNNSYCPTCLIVTETADNVVAYCLQAEHSTGDDIVKWYGKNGKIYMFQSEFPYHLFWILIRIK